MENQGDWEHNNLISELTQGMELARLLQMHLNIPSSQETREGLVQQIVSSYEKALSMLNWSSSSSAVGGLDQPAAHAAAVQPVSGSSLAIESPPLSGSPRSEDSDRDQELKDGSKKRKASPRRRQVRVHPGAGLEGTLDDGFSWRKYGQKEILGAKYPRGYYRCTHRHVQGCLATKQVQRSDEDPMVFEITYRGWHTCTQASKTTNSSILTPPEIQEPNNITVDPLQQQLSNYQQQQQDTQEALYKLRENLRVVTQDLDIHHHESLPHHFHFPSTSTPDHHYHHHPHHQSQVFSPSMMSTNSTLITTTGSVNFPSPGNIMSPATPSRTSFFPPISASPSGVINSFPGNPNTTNTNNNQNFQTSDQSAELNEIISAAASAANSPTVGVDFPFGNTDQFEQNFTFDNLGYFSSFRPFEK